MQALFLSTREDEPTFEKVVKQFAVFKRIYTTVSLDFLFLNDVPSNRGVCKQAIQDADIVVGVTTPTFFLHLVTEQEIFNLLSQRRNQGKILTSIRLIECPSDQMNQPFRGLTPLNYHRKGLTNYRTIDEAVNTEKIVTRFESLVKGLLNPPPSQAQVYYVPSQQSPAPAQKQPGMQCPRCGALKRSQTYCTSCGHVFNAAPPPARQIPVRPSPSPAPTQPKQQQQPAPAKAKPNSVLILYSRKDQNYANACMSALAAWRLPIEDLYKQAPARYRSEAAQQQLDRSKKIVLLLSSDCISELYSDDKLSDLVTIFDKLTPAQTSQIESVIVRPCLYQAIGQKPYRNKPVSQIADKDQFWTDFASHIASQM